MSVCFIMKLIVTQISSVVSRGQNSRTLSVKDGKQFTDLFYLKVIERGRTPSKLTTNLPANFLQSI